MNRSFLVPTAVLRGVVFDLDDTLYPERQFVIGGIREAARRVLPGIADASTTFETVLREGHCSRIFDEGLKRLGRPPTPALVSALVAAYRGHRPRLRPFRGVFEMLRALRSQGLRLGLLTQGQPEVQWRKIEALRIASLFDQIEVADLSRGEGKPHPAPYRRMEEGLGVQGGKVVMVGDCPTRDFPAAEHLGWWTVRLRLRGTFHRDAEDPSPGRPEARSIRTLCRILLRWSAVP